MLKKVLGVASLVALMGAAQVSSAAGSKLLAVTICNHLSSTFVLSTKNVANIVPNSSEDVITGKLAPHQCRSFGQTVTNVDAAGMFIDMSGSVGTPELTYADSNGIETATPHFQGYPASASKLSTTTTLSTLNIDLQ